MVGRNRGSYPSPMTTPATDDHTAFPPAPPESVAVVEAELRAGWWPSTLAVMVPTALAVVVGYLVVLEVRDGDWLALVFPGAIPLLCGLLAGWLVYKTIRTKAAERRLPADQRAQAVYVRGLTGTHRIGANQDADALAVLDRVWARDAGKVVAVRRLRTHRTWQAVREILEVDVRLPSGKRTALLTVAPDAVPKVGAGVNLLVDPHHPRAVVDLRARGRRQRRTT